MRHLQSIELSRISGGDYHQGNRFSDPFLAGMKGGDINPHYTSQVTLLSPVFGALLGLAGFTVKSNPILYTTVGAVGGACFGAFAGWLFVNNEYHMGQNYAEAMKIVSSGG